jgi:CheY-like chemotaxis protein
MNMAEPLRILFVEDSEIDALLVTRQLRQAGYALEMQRVENEPDLRKALQEHEWDVILSDYSMPHLNGAVALRVLREIGIDIPFIVISGTMGEEAAVQLMKAGAHDFF